MSRSSALEHFPFHSNIHQYDRPDTTSVFKPLTPRTCEDSISAQDDVDRGNCAGVWFLVAISIYARFSASHDRDATGISPRIVVERRVVRSTIDAYSPVPSQARSVAVETERRFGIGRWNRHRERLEMGLMIGSDLRPLCQFQRVFDINAKVADRAISLRMTEQDLHRVDFPSLCR